MHCPLDNALLPTSFRQIKKTMSMSSCSSEGEARARTLSTADGIVGWWKIGVVGGWKSAAKCVILPNHSADSQSKHTVGKLFKNHCQLFLYIFRICGLDFRLTGKTGKPAKNVQQNASFSITVQPIFKVSLPLESYLKIIASCFYAFSGYAT